MYYSPVPQQLAPNASRINNMKIILLPLLIAFILVACKTPSDNAIEIKGHVNNSERHYITLNYAPKLRGNLNFDGFESVGSHIDLKGNFNLHSDKITDGASYTLEFDNKGISLILFAGDNVELDFDVKKLDNSIIATGIGAGKINVLRLKQFDSDSFDSEKYLDIDEFASYTDSVISEQIILLNSIYFKKPDDTRILEADNKIEIQKIITDSPLTEKEYKFLLNRISFQRYWLLNDFLSKQSELKSLASIKIDFDSKAFRYFNIHEYRELENINDWLLAHSLESILQIEYLRKVVEDNIDVTYGNWQSLFNNSDYESWINSFLKDHFNDQVYTKYYADLSAWYMTLGYDYKMYYEKLNATTGSSKYIKRLNEFENLLQDGVTNKDYIPKENNSNLDKSKLESLLGNYRGKSLFIVFWSAQYAGASVINNLPSIKDFEKENKENVDIINICIDKEENKRIWVARIIDNSWKSKHYFLPMEGNESILNRFSNKNISSFCDGGATYAFINKKGVVNSPIEFPFHLSTNEIEKMIE